MKKLLIIALALHLTACALPTTTVKTGAARPTLSIIGAPANTLLYLDGLEAGAANNFNGAPNTLLVEEGAHRVELRLGGQVILAQQIFSSNGENSKVTYSAGGAQ